VSRQVREAAKRTGLERSVDTDRIVAALKDNARRRDRTLVALGAMIIGMLALNTEELGWPGILLLFGSASYLIFRRR
jgi:hypothetical protein